MSVTSCMPCPEARMDEQIGFCGIEPVYISYRMRPTCLVLFNRF